MDGCILQKSFPFERLSPLLVCSNINSTVIIILSVFVSAVIEECTSQPLYQYIFNPNHQRSSKGHFLGEKPALLESGTFASSNGEKLLPGMKYRP